MKSQIFQQTLFRLYGWGWNLVIPILKRHGRLAEGFEERARYPIPDTSMDLWVHAASAGEAYLAWELLKRLTPAGPTRLLLTTNTKEGMDILNRAREAILPGSFGVTMMTAYLPFDKPGVMGGVVRQINPRVMVLLETELWPGLLAALKKTGCKRLIVNGRITPRSLRSYMLLPFFWRSLRPDAILAISDSDAQRFSLLFKGCRIAVMPNMKFDRIDSSGSLKEVDPPFNRLIPPDIPFVVLGSIRKEEEIDVDQIIAKILQDSPGIIIGLFPRHPQRLDKWRKRLMKRRVSWILRSKAEPPVRPGTVILWDTFTELTRAYTIARAAFVGGSLAPLGGQNFLEALACGVRPVLGPHWENFKWIGPEIIKNGLVRQVETWEQVTNVLIGDIKSDFNRGAVQHAVQKYIRERQGGTDQACREILRFLDG